MKLVLPNYIYVFSSGLGQVAFLLMVISLMVTGLCTMDTVHMWPLPLKVTAGAAQISDACALFFTSCCGLGMPTLHFWVAELLLFLPGLCSRSGLTWNC
jgi:hypothetical protein